MINLKINLQLKRNNINVFVIKKDKIISYDITVDNNKFYTLKKKENIEKEIDLSSIIDKPSYIAIDEEIDIKLITLPNVKNRKILNTLILKELYNDLLPGESYIIKYKDLTTENKESTYVVYFTQEKKFFDYLKDKYEYIKCFSFIPFALSSYNIPFGNVIHFYHDDENFYSILTNNGIVEYVRVVALDLDKDLSVSDNIILTYNYLLKTKKNIDSVIISGDITNKSNIIESLYRTFNIPIALINPHYFKIKEEDFLDLIIPVGLINLNENYNFIPKSITKKLNFIKYLKLTLIILTILTIFNSFKIVNLSLNTLNNFFEIQNILNENKLYEEKLSKRLSNKNLDVIATFFNLELKHSQNIQAINEILKLEKYLVNGYEELNFSFNKGKVVYKITFEKTFSSFTEMEKFVEDLGKVKDINIKIEKDIKSKKVKVVLTYEKHIN